MNANKISGAGFLAAGLSASGVTAYFAFNGFVSMGGAFGYGFMSVPLAFGLFAAGVWFETAIKSRKLGAIVRSIVVLGLFAYADQYVGELNLQLRADAKIDVHNQALAAFEQTKAQAATVASQIEKAQADLAKMDAALVETIDPKVPHPDVFKAQAVLFKDGFYPKRPDGKFGEKTEAAIVERAAEIRAAMPGLLASANEYAEAMKVPPAAEVRTLDPHVWSIGATALAVVLTFIGSMQFFGLRPDSTPEAMAAIDLERERLAEERRQFDAEQALVDRGLEGFNAFLDQFEAVTQAERAATPASH